MLTAALYQRWRKQEAVGSATRSFRVNSVYFCLLFVYCCLFVSFDVTVKRVDMAEVDDVEITDVHDEDSPFVVEKTPLRNRDLSSLSETVGELLSQYGWVLLLVLVLVYLLIQHLNKRRSRQSSPPPQDAVLVASRQAAMEAARMKMQEELNAKAQLFREKQKQQEEEKRRQKIEMWDSMKEGRSCRNTKPPQSSEEAGSSTTVLKPKSDKKTLRSSDYNPLTGQGGGSSCSWRPGRRGPSSGG